MWYAVYSCFSIPLFVPGFIHPQPKSPHVWDIMLPNHFSPTFPAASSSNMVVITGLFLSCSRMLHVYEAKFPGLAFAVFHNLASSCFLFHDSSKCSSSVSRSLSVALSPMVPCLFSACKSYHYTSSKHGPRLSAFPTSHWKGWETRFLK